MMSKCLASYCDPASLYQDAMSNKYRFIALVGADGMGKTYLADALQTQGAAVYHFDKEFFYNGTGKKKQYFYNLFFWDVWSKLKTNLEIIRPLVWDRTALCGAVYNGDLSVLKEYQERLKGERVLHVLVDGTGIIEDVLERRHPDWSDWEKSQYIDRAKLYTNRYEGYLRNCSELDWVIYKNMYDMDTCIKHVIEDNPNPVTVRARMMNIYG